MKPSRLSTAHGPHRSRVAAIPAGDAKTKGLALGIEVAAAVVALRAIVLADDDGKPATTSDAAWTPVAPTPNHPEYPAAHSCTFGALGETLRQYYGTRQVSYTLDSAVTGTTRTYATTGALNDETHLARVRGGMHFAFSTAVGVELGTRVAQWVAAHHSGRRQ